MPVYVLKGKPILKKNYANQNLSIDAFLNLCSIFYAIDVNTNKIIPVTRIY